MKRARSALEPLGLVLQRDSGLRVPGTVETSPIASRDWEAAVGSRIAARARPVRLDRGVLVVRTATATWAQELALLADQILAQLRARGVAVDSLRFRVGHVDAPERPPARSEVRTAPPEVPLPAAVKSEVERVADLDLREAIARAAAKNLGWQAALPPAKKARRARQEPTSAPSVARAPRSAGRESDPPARGPKPAPGARRGRP
jgi:hypothetical protein